MAKRVKLSSVYGDFWIPRGDAIGGHLVKWGCYEGGMLAKWRSILEAGDVALDIGACYGTHSVFMAKMGVEVIAVEPVHWRWAKLNLRENDVTHRVVLHRVAASDKEERLAVKHIARRNRGNTALTEGAVIQASPMDSLVASAVNLAKIDVEGMELKVLAGMTNLLRLSVPHLFVESHGAQATREVAAFLKPYGYTAHGRFNESPTYYYRKC
jgi:FkbM family methyltransferase